jgi:hypothetical protein
MSVMDGNFMNSGELLLTGLGILLLAGFIWIVVALVKSFRE